VNPPPGPKEIIAILLAGAKAAERQVDMGLDHLPLGGEDIDVLAPGLEHTIDFTKGDLLL
jgi:hypothetical protein